MPLPKGDPKAGGPDGSPPPISAGGPPATVTPSDTSLPAAHPHTGTADAVGGAQGGGPKGGGPDAVGGAAGLSDMSSILSQLSDLLKKLVELLQQMSVTQGGGPKGGMDMSGCDMPGMDGKTPSIPGATQQTASGGGAAAAPALAAAGGAPAAAPASTTATTTAPRPVYDAAGHLVTTALNALQPAADGTPVSANDPRAAAAYAEIEAGFNGLSGNTGIVGIG